MVEEALEERAREENQPAAEEAVGEAVSGEASPPKKPIRPKKEKAPKKKPVSVSQLSAAEVEKTVVALGNQGHSPSEIGVMLRDQYGVFDAKEACGKKVEEILAEHDLAGEVPADLLNLIRKSVSLQNHLKEHGKDFTAKRGYQLTVSKIHKLSRYYRQEGRLSRDWRYDAQQAALLVK